LCKVLWRERVVDFGGAEPEERVRDSCSGGVLIRPVPTFRSGLDAEDDIAYLRDRERALEQGVDETDDMLRLYGERLVERDDVIVSGQPQSRWLPGTTQSDEIGREIVRGCLAEKEALQDNLVHKQSLGA